MHGATVRQAQPHLAVRALNRPVQAAGKHASHTVSPHRQLGEAHLGAVLRRAFSRSPNLCVADLLRSTCIRRGGRDAGQRRGQPRRHPMLNLCRRLLPAPR